VISYFSGIGYVGLMLSMVQISIRTLWPQ